MESLESSPERSQEQELVNRVLETAERERVRFVNLQFTDIVGMVKTVAIPISRFYGCIEHGMWFDGSSIEGFARIAESDMYLQPDLSTFAINNMTAATAELGKQLFSSGHVGPSGR